jgi:arachidonate 15-lipoxygenase
VSEDWSWSYEFLPPLAMSAKLPLSQLPDLRWIGRVVVVSLELLRNRLQWEAHRGVEVAGELLSGELDLTHLKLPSLNVHEFSRSLVHLADAEFTLTGADADVSLDSLELLGERHIQHTQVLGLATHLRERGVVDPFDILAEVLRLAQGDRRIDGERLSDWFDVYRSLPEPPGLHRDPDALFDWALVTGPNPILLEAVVVGDERLEGIPVDADALEQGRVFVVDLTMLSLLQAGEFPHGAKHVGAPRIWLTRTAESPRVRVRWIQPSADAPPVARGDDGWERARVFASVALTTHHEMVAHLGQTHLVLDPLVVSMHRNLAADHSVRRLLEPHLEGTIAINYSAHQTLVAPKQIVDKLLPSTLATSLKLAVWGLNSFGFDKLALPDYLAARGTKDAELDYPWRDDALLVWRAIESFVGDWVEANWADDDAVAGDAPLQAWQAEATAPTGGRLPGFAPIGDRQRLVRVLTQIVYTASAGHWAVNHPQTLLMACAGVMPLASYAPDSEPWDLQQALPPLDMAMLQLEALTLLGSVVHTRLGQLPESSLTSPDEEAALDDFVARLESVSQTIGRRNADRWMPYAVLDPKTLPASINI